MARAKSGLFADYALEFVLQRKKTAKLSDENLCRKAGYSTTALRLWKYGGTASPRIDTVNDMLKVLGYKLAIVKLEDPR